MNTQPGWYDDGSGRQRWWDGQQWTAHYNNQTGIMTDTPKTQPILGYVGLGLALLGTIFACTLNPVLFLIGFILLFAGFVVSLVGLFKKNSTKWPSIVGMILSFIGAGIGIFVLIVGLAASTLSGSGTSTSPDSPSVTEPGDVNASPEETDEDSADRPSPEIIATEFKKLAVAGGVDNYDALPTFYPCIGDELYNSSISDETLWTIIQGGDPPESEYDDTAKLLQDAIFTCDPDGVGAWG